MHPIHSNILLTTLLAGMFFLSCNVKIKKNQEMTDDEKAAQLITDQMPQEGYKLTNYISGYSDYISIIYHTDNSLGGQSIALSLAYNQNAKKWSASAKKKDMRAGTTAVLENLTPKSGWLSLIQKLLEQDFLSIRTAEEMGYKKVLADGNGYGMEIRIADQKKVYNHANAHFYAENHPEFEDLKAFTKVIDIFNEEFEIKFE